MHPSLESLGIDKLSIEERLALMHEIWDSIAEQPIPMDSEQQREIERRLDAYYAEPSDVIGWDEVLKRVSGKPGE